MNPSFETYTSCPTGPDELYKCLNWKSYKYSPDYMNTCSSVPANWAGYQQPASGNAYSGFATFTSKTIFSNYREFIGGTLLTPLVIGTKYFASFKVSLAFSNPFQINCASDKMGLNFSTVPRSVTSPALITNSAKVYSNSIITDSTNWTRIFGSFIADSAYNYIIVGNFFNDNNTDTLIMDASSTCQGAYYFLDDVCVSTDSSFTANYSVGIRESQKQNIFIYPNPIFTYFNLDIASSELPIKLTLYNKIGEEILFKEINSSHNVIDLPDVPPGLLLLKIYYNQRYFYYKLLKQ